MAQKQKQSKTSEKSVRRRTFTVPAPAFDTVPETLDADNGRVFVEQLLAQGVRATGDPVRVDASWVDDVRSVELTYEVPVAG